MGNSSGNSDITGHQYHTQCVPLIMSSEDAAAHASQKDSLKRLHSDGHSSSYAPEIDDSSELSKRRRLERRPSAGPNAFSNGEKRLTLDIPTESNPMVTGNPYEITDAMATGVAADSFAEAADFASSVLASTPHFPASDTSTAAATPTVSMVGGGIASATAPSCGTPSFTPFATWNEYDDQSFTMAAVPSGKVDAAAEQVQLVERLAKQLAIDFREHTQQQQQAAAAAAAAAAVAAAPASAAATLATIAGPATSQQVAALSLATLIPVAALQEHLLAALLLRASDEPKVMQKLN